jgi:hypothetical protein
MNVSVRRHGLRLSGLATRSAIRRATVSISKGGTINHIARRFTFAGLALLALAALSGQAFAGNTAVGLCAAPGIHYFTIQDAVTAAELLGTPRTVRVCPGTYAEQVNITASLTLEGISSGTSDAAVVEPPSGGLVENGTDIFGNPVAAQIFVASASGNVTVEYLTVDATGNNSGNGGANGSGCSAPTLEGIYFQNTSGVISHNTVRNQYQTDFTDYGGCQNGLAINVESTTSSNTVTVSANSVRAYQKNGITATGAATGGSLGPGVTISGNRIVGMGATAMNWTASAGAAENGIQLGYGASGSISTNVVNDNIWENDNSSQPGNAASGILVYASPNITVSGNDVGSAQFGIVADTDPNYGSADGTQVTSNKVSGTHIFDAIDVCSSTNTVHGNTIYGSAQSAIHFDDSCGSGSNNSATGNTINEACAGILLGSGTNTQSGNGFANVTYTTLAGDVCPPAVEADLSAGGSKKAQRLRPSPYKATRK